MSRILGLIMRNSSPPIIISPNNVLPALTTWSTAGASIVSGNILREDGTNGAHTIFTQVSAIAGTRYSITFWVKALNRAFFTIGLIYNGRDFYTFGLNGEGQTGYSLSGGATGISSVVIAYTKQGSGIYRINIAYTALNSGMPFISPSPSDVPNPNTSSLNVIYQGLNQDALQILGSELIIV